MFICLYGQVEPILSNKDAVACEGAAPSSYVVYGAQCQYVTNRRLQEHDREFAVKQSPYVNGEAQHEYAIQLETSRSLAYREGR